MRTTWLGIIFFVALGLLAIGTVGVGDVPVLRDTKTLDVGFENVEGLREGDDVRVNGMGKGRVQKVRPLTGAEAAAYPRRPDGRLPRVGVRLRMDGDTVLFDDLAIKVETVAALGGMVVSIDGGSPERPEIDWNARYTGYAVAQPLAQLGDILSTHEASLSEVVANIAEFTRHLKEGQAGRALAGDELYDKILEVLDSSNETMKALASGRSFGMDPESETRRKLDAMLGEADAAVAEARKAFEALNTGEGAGAMLLNDPEFRAKLEKAVTDAGESLDRVSKEIASITEAVREQKGIAGRMIYDEKLAEDATKAVESIRKAAENIEKMTQDAAEGRGTVGKLFQDEELYDSALGAAKGADELLGRLQRTEVRFDADYLQAFDKEYGIATIGVEYWPDADKFFKFAVNLFQLDPGDDVTYKRQTKKGAGATQEAFTVLGGFRVPWFFDDTMVVYGGLLEGAPGGGFRFEFDIGDYPLWWTVEGRSSHSDFGGEDLDEEIDGPLMRSYLTGPLWVPGGDDFMSTIFGSIRLHAGANNLLDEPEILAGVGMYWTDQDLKTLVGLIGLSQ